jgi:hypothetical protein
VKPERCTFARKRGRVDKTNFLFHENDKNESIRSEQNGGNFCIKQHEFHVFLKINWEVSLKD